MPEAERATPEYSARTYLTHFPVQSYLEADILSKEHTWNILGSLRRSGARGMTAGELSKTLNLPPSIVYATLKELRRLGFVFLYPREKGGRPPKDRKKRYLTHKSTWGKYAVESGFLSAMEFAGISDMVIQSLRPSLVDVLGKTFAEFKTRKELRAFLPLSGESNICPNCGRSHEAMEFIYAVIIKAIDSFIMDSKEVREFLAERGYST
ncbi:MAG: helix-turn-helix domain-containing protein [Nitrososphaerales archaeon]|jgi:DNA-binding transcriptional ArsR family regulator